MEAILHKFSPEGKPVSNVQTIPCGVQRLSPLSDPLSMATLTLELPVNLTLLFFQIPVQLLLLPSHHYTVIRFVSEITL